MSRLPEYIHQANVAGLERANAPKPIKRAFAPINQPTEAQVFARLHALVGAMTGSLDNPADYAAITFLEAVEPESFVEREAWNRRFTEFCNAQV